MSKKFDTEITVRPHEIDYNGHVHQSIYLDYVLHARVDQMRRCYKMPIEDFFNRGFSWATKSTSIRFHRPLFMQDKAIIRTWIQEIGKSSVHVCFRIMKKESGKLCAEGEALYVLINSRTGKTEMIPDDIRNNYSV